MRLPKGIAPENMFKPIKYVLVSYPLLSAPALGIFKTGWYFRALEGLVGGYWEGCLVEPPADVLTLMGSEDVCAPASVYWLWAAILQSKRHASQGAFNQIIIKGADHVWTSEVNRIGEEVTRWIREEVHR